MKSMLNLSEWRKKRNRIISKATAWKDRISLFCEVWMIRTAAYIANMASSQYKESIVTDVIEHTGDDQTLVLNCMGHVDVPEHPKKYEGDLKSIAGLLKKADVSVASYYPGTAEREDDNAQIVQLLQKYGVSCIPPESDYISARLFRSEIGGVGFIFYRRSKDVSRRKHVKVELMRRILTLRTMGAEYIVIYVENRRKKAISTKEARLYRMLSRLGADYIVGVTPNLRDSGTTYLARDGVARSLYSLGTFLTEDTRLSNKRVVVRIKLKRVKGRLQLFEETYFPYYEVKNSLVSLILGNPKLVSEEKRRRYVSDIEREMSRLRPANRLLTVKRLMGIIGEELPEKYAYLADFSVGTVCARSFEVKPGDVLFFRQPFEDANDLEPVNPRKRLRIARNSAKKGAMLILSFQELSVPCPWIKVKNAMEAHIAVCAYLRNLRHMRVIGITGSVGKTSTKDMLAEVMMMRYATEKSERNSNVQVKIGLNIQKLCSDCEVYIQEIGGGRPGGASRHARMVSPEVTVVTNIGNAHVGNFGSQEKLMQNKLGITEGMPKQGVVYLNGDDPLLWTAKPSCKTVFYAVKNKEADYYVEGIKEGVQTTEFFIVHKKERTKVKLNVLGEYNVLNAVCCFAIGEHFGIPTEDIVCGLSHFRTSGIRQNLVQVCGRKFFMDCYNASSESVKSSMSVLKKIRIAGGNKRIAVLGDITGMGELTEEVHLNMAQTLMKYPVDRYLFFGQSVEKPYEILRENGFSCELTRDRRQLNDLLQKNVNPGDVVLFKGSSKGLLEQSVDMVFGTRLTDQRLVDEVEFRRVNRAGIGYNLFATYGTVVRYSGGHEEVKIRKNVGGIEIVNIGKAFFHSRVKRVQLPDSIRHIAGQAFRECSQLHEIHMPRGLKFIGNKAFKNCTSLETVTLPEGVLHIGTEAFSGCTGLKKLVIPESVVQIGNNAFDECGAILWCKKGSYAAQYLERRKVAYMTY